MPNNHAQARMATRYARGLRAEDDVRLKVGMTLRTPLRRTSFILASLRQSPEESVLVAFNLSIKGQRLVFGGI